MEMNNIPEMFQSKLRLMIVSGLIKQPLSFAALKQLTGATDGNLSVQISKLTDAGYIVVRKEFAGKKTADHLRTDTAWPGQFPAVCRAPQPHPGG